MTKLNSSKIITIKINGKKRTFQEETVKIKPENGKQNLPDAMGTVSPIRERKSISETAVTKELSDDSFEWILPETEAEIIPYENNEGDVSSFAKVNKKPMSSSLKSIILSVVFAVLLGTSFGVLMLKLVSTEQSKHTAQKAPAAAINDKKALPAAATTSDFILKPWTAYVVQGGVYSSRTTANKVLSNTTESGIPASLIEDQEKQYLLIGIANTMEQAKNLANYFREKGTVDVYSKTLNIPEKKLSNLNAEEKAFIKEAAALFPLLTKATANPTVSVSLPTETMNAITRHETNIVKMNSQHIQEKKVEKLKSEIIAAAEQVKIYQKKNEKKALAAAQQHLLSFLSLYYTF